MRHSQRLVKNVAQPNHQLSSELAVRIHLAPPPSPRIRRFSGSRGGADHDVAFDCAQPQMIGFMSMLPFASGRSAFSGTPKNFHSARAFRRSNMRTITLIV